MQVNQVAPKQEGKGKHLLIKNIITQARFKTSINLLQVKTCYNQGLF